MESGMTDVVVVGLGTDGRGDDAAGLEVADRVAARVPTGVQVHRVPGCELTLLDLWRDAPLAIVIDAAASGALPGTVHHVDAMAGPLGRPVPRTSSHAFGLPDVIELGRALDRMPQRLVVIGIEVERVSSGAGMSPAVWGGVLQAVRLVEAELARASAALREPHAV